MNMIENATYHNTHVPYIDGKAPIDFQHNLWRAIDTRLGIDVPLLIPIHSFAKIAQHRSAKHFGPVERPGGINCRPIDELAGSWMLQLGLDEFV